MSSTDAFPSDWDKSPLPRGAYRNVKHCRYDIKLTVAGAQRYIGVAYDQATAAKMYDAALFKLCPKIAKRLQPNDPDGFTLFQVADINQGQPRLVGLYDNLPYLKPEHAAKSELFLREARLTQWLVQDNTFKPDTTSPYDRTLSQLRRLQSSQLDQCNKLKNSLSKIPYTGKVPDITRRLAEVLNTWNVLHENLALAVASFERNKSFYGQNTRSKISS